MDDLISRAAALDAISTDGGCGMCARRVLDIPAVDAVPVVRCGDCKMRSDGGYCPDTEMYVGEHFFCALGRRRESE